MKNRFKLLIMFSALLCLALAAVTSADSCTKTLYVDGNMVGSATDGNGLTLTWINYQILIGTDGRSTQTRPVFNQYAAKMDEFAIYAGKLDPNRIKAHYNAQSGNYYSAVHADNPLLWLRFEDANVLNNGNIAANSGSLAVNGVYTMTDNVRFSSVVGGGIAGSNALQFPAAQTDGTGSFVVVDDSSGQLSTNLNGKVTIELWVDCNNIDINNDYPVLFQHNGSDNWPIEGSYGLEVNGPSILGVVGGGQIDYVNLPYTIGDNTWHQIVVTYDSNYSPPPPVVYKADGTYVGEVNADNPVLWLRFEDAQPKDYSAADGNHWVGYGGAASIVSKVGGIGNSVMLNWPLPVPGSGYTGMYAVAATNNPNSPPDVNSSYEVFDHKYAFAPGSITFEMWIKSLLPMAQMVAQGSSGIDYGIFFQQLGAHTNESHGPGMSNCWDEIRIYAGGTGTAPALYTGVPSPFDQKWHQLVVIYDVNNVNWPIPNLHVLLYGDGKLVSEHTRVAPDANLGTELSHIMLGAENDIGNTYNVLPIYIDEFAIYAGVLGADRVLAHYTAWQPKSCAEMQARGLGLLGDMDGNCKINFVDLAVFASQWRKCNDPSGNCPGCTPNSCPPWW
jgi:hypothetical protein